MAAKPKPNGPLVEIFPNVWAIEGLFNLGPGVLITRVMAIARVGDELTIFNSARVGEKEEKEIEALGTIKHVVRLCSGHGADDVYYKEKYGATLWGIEGWTWANGTIKPDKDLEKESPYPDVMQAVVGKAGFADKIKGDAVMLLKMEKGILIGSDAVQSYGEEDLKLSAHKPNWMGGMIMWLFGFKGRAVCPKLFFNIHVADKKPASIKAYFDAIKALDFDALIPCHGQVIKTGAKAAFDASYASLKF